MVDYNAILGEMASEMGISAAPVEEDTSPDSYASTDGNAIYVNPQFMSKIASSAGEGGIRFVLAHELGHIVNGMDIDGHKGEFEADKFASRAVARMGDDLASVIGVMSHMPMASSETHPGAGQRQSTATAAYEGESGNLMIMKMRDKKKIRKKKARDKKMRKKSVRQRDRRRDET